MLDNLNTKQKIVFLLIIFLMISFIIFYIYSTHSQETPSNATTLEYNSLFYDNIIDEKNTTLEDSLDIIIYICGEVQNPQVLTIKEGSRIIDAINAANGLTENADITNINLASLLNDGDKIYIPQNGEETETEVNYNTNLSKKININTASQTDLETLPGIGPSTALKIIEYRNEHGKYLKIEDIQNVSGIGSAKFENIKNYICIK